MIHPEYFEPDPVSDPEPVKPPRNPGVDLMSKPLYGNEFVHLYNPSWRMHHYTDDPSEISSLTRNGWQRESALGRIPNEGKILYRLVNNNTGESASIPSHSMRPKALSSPVGKVKVNRE